MNILPPIFIEVVSVVFFSVGAGCLIALLVLLLIHLWNKLARAVVKAVTPASFFRCMHIVLTVRRKGDPWWKDFYLREMMFEELKKACDQDPSLDEFVRKEWNKIFNSAQHEQNVGD